MGRDGVERSGRREDQPPAERQRALAASSCPTGSSCPGWSRAQGYAERWGVPVDGLVERRPRAGPEPRLEDGRRRASIPRNPFHQQLVAVVAPDARDARRPMRGRRRDDPDPVRHTEVRDDPAGRRAAAARRGRARAATWRSRWRRIHASRSARNSWTNGSGRAQPRRPAGGSDTTTPRSGWIVTRRRRERGDRRRMYGMSPSRDRRTAACSVALAAEREERITRRGSSGRGAWIDRSGGGRCGGADSRAPWVRLGGSAGPGGDPVRLRGTGIPVASRRQWRRG